jgi:formate dehydrogenase maturation protein FdhE
MSQAAAVDAPWAERRRRSAELSERLAFAREVLRLYAALLDVQDRAFWAAREQSPPASEMAAYAAQRILPEVIEASIAAGPERLAASVAERRDPADLEAVVGRWLRGEEQSLVDRYLARAASEPLFLALGDAARAACQGVADERHCPHCGGPPQLSCYEQPREALVTGQRHLLCARCGATWPYPRMTCAGCGELSSARLLVFSEEGTSSRERCGHVVPGATGVTPENGAPPAPGARFAHMRIDACESCHRYLLGVDLGKDGRAVPVVDELAAIPLDLYAAERGLRKVTPNLMGF